MKRLSSLFLVSLFSGAVTLGAYKLFIEKATEAIPSSQKRLPIMEKL